MTTSEGVAIVTESIFFVRRQYRSLDIFDQVRQHNHYKMCCVALRIDMFLLTCTDEHFQDLLIDQHNELTCSAV